MEDFGRVAAVMAEMKASTEANNEKFEVLRGVLISQMDIHQARTEAMQEKNRCRPKGN
jgi:hypothetical protein